MGTPDFLRDAKYLKILYKDLLVQKTDFFQNILYGVIFLRKREELALVSPAEETRWLDALNDDVDQSAPTLGSLGQSPPIWGGGRGVSYVLSANKIVIPEVFLMAPLFASGFPNSVNLGGLGVYMARAMLEGVLGRGLLFEADGTLRPHNSTGNGNTLMFGSSSRDANIVTSPFADPRAVLERDARCLVDKYSVRGIDSVGALVRARTDSALTVAAVTQAFVTLEDILELERGILLPAMEQVDPQAVFFLSFGQTLCYASSDKQGDIERTTTNVLSPKHKLMGTVSQIEEFSQFYSCGGWDEEQSCGRIV